MTYKITIHVKFQNHIYGHKSADDKIKTDHRQTMSEKHSNMKDNLKHVQFEAMHTIFLWISYIYPFVIIETSELKSMRSAKYVVNIISVTLGCIKLPYDSILMYKYI